MQSIQIPYKQMAFYTLQSTSPVKLANHLTIMTYMYVSILLLFTAT